MRNAILQDVTLSESDTLGLLFFEFILPETPTLERRPRGCDHRPPL
jgi:hypothetical protein